MAILARGRNDDGTWSPWFKGGEALDQRQKEQDGSSHMMDEVNRDREGMAAPNQQNKSQASEPDFIDIPPL